jgi:hypothetical protein
MLTFQRDLSQVLQKDISWVVKLVKGQEIYIHFKGAEKEFAITNFLKQML